jgi:hypothetical protein
MSTKAMPVEVQMALGRIFALMSRPAQAGDVEQYEAARRVVLTMAEEAGRDTRAGYAHDYGRDYRSIVMSGG